ncbi:hypothetical protein [Nocardioides jishulii]|uniref:Uncharacterized protein n=1 Tax=Nocardioides jishulii TaxID=2575440 RepID=A0A4U2YT36_9ACTN|nr:hypothetical protein [Nocardioides jishulii]QCX26403.1 hypothetical protein FCL41_01725 [Nocardioides jishulii]TKI63792.1 hypothetical protein FC770_00980 [Nocardioides jishulii]
MTHVTPSRRAVIRTAAWSVPAVTVAAAAPAFAASPPVAAPDMSTTVASTPTRGTPASTLHFAAFDMINTGTADTAGIVMTFSNSAGIITGLTGTYFGATVDLDGFSGITVTGLDTNSATATFPPNFFGKNATPTTPMSTTVRINVETASTAATTISVTTVAANIPSGPGSTSTFNVPA